MICPRFLAPAFIALGSISCALIPGRALAQGGNDPLANVPKLRQALSNNGFEFLKGKFKILDPVLMACTDRGDGKTYIPSTWYNNVQPYMSIIMPGSVSDPPFWEKATRAIPVNYLLRQDEAILIVGSTPPPMAYYSFQTMLFARFNPATFNYDPTLGGFYQPYEATVAYLGDTVNNLTVRTTTPFNSPMALISTGNRQTQERVIAALHSAGYPDAAINTEILPLSLVRFGYETGDQFLFTMRLALAAGGDQAFNDFESKVEAGRVMQVFRVRPKVESAVDPLTAPVLRTRGTGQTEMDLYPTMEKLRHAILAHFASGYKAEELDTFLPDYFPEGYPALQRGIAYMGPGRDGSAGYGRDANYWVSPWFDLPDNAFAILYGVDHAATGKATYSSAAVYLDETIAAGVSDVNSGDFAKNPHTANAYLPGEPGIDKFYVWKVARNCNGEVGCMDARLLRPEHIAACSTKIAANAPVRIGFRQYMEPATKIGPADAELLYDRVIVFRPK